MDKRLVIRHGFSKLLRRMELRLVRHTRFQELLRLHTLGRSIEIDVEFLPVVFSYHKPDCRRQD